MNSLACVLTNGLGSYDMNEVFLPYVLFTGSEKFNQRIHNLSWQKLINSGMRLLELFDNAVEWYDQGQGTYTFTIGENTYRVFTRPLDNEYRKYYPKNGPKLPKEATLISFGWVGGDGEKTAADVTRLFSTVMAILKRHVTTPYVVFTASPQKSGLYDRLVNRFAVDSVQTATATDSLGMKWYVVKL